ncbi:hypothetical protein, conserved [Leishmania donovani]|uniref:Uncharacterized protein n=1 Tax=Leishmania donovani TaxID=5661 RepID=E9BSF8_LEIDO|nr:hypothetical protein, conserved [Leishmania donovani]CBZ38187.1 hypothetical protein, conserved [Leishmania donovani]
MAAGPLSRHVHGLAYGRMSTKQRRSTFPNLTISFSLSHFYGQMRARTCVCVLHELCVVLRYSTQPTERVGGAPGTSGNGLEGSSWQSSFLSGGARAEVLRRLLQ